VKDFRRSDLQRESFLFGLYLSAFDANLSRSNFTVLWAFEALTSLTASIDVQVFNLILLKFNQKYIITRII
jgi:hypothetical protein